MITASHNPGEYNGLKFMQPDGQCLSAAAMMQLAHLYRSKIFKLTDHTAEFEVAHDEQATARHVERVLGCVDRAKIRRLHLAVLLDSVNGAGGLGARNSCIPSRPADSRARRSRRRNICTRRRPGSRRPRWPSDLSRTRTPTAWP
jgi:hypothetical protein